MPIETYIIMSEMINTHFLQDRIRKCKMKLLVIADDFTGALDTGVQFRAKNSLIRIREAQSKALFENLDPEVQVLIIDAETRHMPSALAYQTVYDIVAEAGKANVPCIYKKTDSALRGNIGGELSAALAASGQTQLHFVPAFPRMDRETRDGIHYISGVPVAESVFGADAFEPVRCSAVADIIGQQSDVAVLPVRKNAWMDAESHSGILLYDASTDEDLQAIAQHLKKTDRLKLFAGCAGFAAMLPALLQLEQRSDHLPQLPPRLLTICGSINPITVRQMDAAEQRGMARVRLTPRQKLETSWMEQADGQRCLKGWQEILEEEGNLIIECGSAFEETNLAAFEQEFHIRREDMRVRIADNLGKILKQLLNLGIESTIMVTGGDTLRAFMHQIHLSELADICEVMPGVVLAEIVYKGKKFALISKSGGFGEENLLICLLKTVSAASPLMAGVTQQ